MMGLFILQALLGPIGRQELPREGCAAYLWTLGEPRQLVAMAEPERLRIRLDGKPLDLTRTAAEGAAGLGLATSTRYAAGEVAATLRLKVEERPDLARGALATDATVTLHRAGEDVVVPVGGMVGCR